MHLVGGQVVHLVIVQAVHPFSIPIEHLATVPIVYLVSMQVIHLVSISVVHPASVRFFPRPSLAFALFDEPSASNVAGFFQFCSSPGAQSVPPLIPPENIAVDAAADAL